MPKFRSGEIQNDFVGRLSVACPLVDLGLPRQIAFKLAIAGKFHLDESLVLGTAGDLEIRRTSAIIHFVADVGWCGEPSKTIKDVEI